MLHVAHIASGGGSAIRANDRRAVVLLCPLLHELHVSDSDRFPSKTVNGVEYPTIDERHTLWSKLIFDKEYYDRDYLSSIWIGRVPEPEPPPHHWREAMFSNLGLVNH